MTTENSTQTRATQGKRSGRRRLLMVSAALVAIFAVAAVAESSGGGTKALGSTSHVVALGIADPVNVPGYGRPEALAADPTRPGIWFVDASQADESLFYWNSNAETLKSYSFGSSSNDLPYGADAAIAVDSAGTVWAGIDTTLLELNTSTGAVQRIAIPAVPNDTNLTGSPGGGAGGPPPLYDSHTITALTVASSGDIAIGLTFSTTLLTYDPSTHAFSQTVLPDGDIASNLSPLANGTIAVATNNSALDLVNPNGGIQRVTDGSNAVGCEGTECVASTNGHTIETINAAPSVTSPDSSSTVPPSPSMSQSAISSATALIGAVPTPLSNGKVIVPSKDGFDVELSSAGTDKDYSLPTVPCEAHAPGDASGGTTSSASITCQEVPEDYVVDSSGNIWFTSNFGQSAIYEMAASSY